jgi:hypothetical protein
MRINTALRHGMLILMVMLLSVPAWADADPNERERALEARVAELERLVHRLLVERDQAPAAVTDAPAREEIDELRTEIARLDEEKARRPSGAGTDFSFSGFIKHDMMMSRYSGGSVPGNSVLRDFYVPGVVPVGGSSSTTDFDTHIRESRFIFNVVRPADDLQAYLEFDFSANTGGDERLTNATSPNIRQAFVRWNNLMAGQAWTTFFNVGALPENLDFVGPAEGTIFVRQAQLRYTSGPWQFAIENPETTVTPFGGGGRIVTDTSNVPDFVLRYNHSADWGQFTIAGLGRQLGIDGPGGTDRELAWALSLSGKFDIGRNDLRWMLSGGPGIGRYLGLNTANEAVLDSQGQLHTIDAYGGFVSYRHLWNNQWRSNFTLSAFRADNDTELTGMNLTRSAESAHVNLIYQATPQLRFGMEYIHARRELESGADGNMNRLQFSTIFGF